MGDNLFHTMSFKKSDESRKKAKKVEKAKKQRKKTIQELKEKLSKTEKAEPLKPENIDMDELARLVAAAQAGQGAVPPPQPPTTTTAQPPTSQPVYDLPPTPEPISTAVEHTTEEAILDPEPEDPDIFAEIHPEADKRRQQPQSAAQKKPGPSAQGRRRTLSQSPPLRRGNASAKSAKRRGRSLTAKSVGSRIGSSKRGETPVVPRGYKAY